MRKALNLTGKRFGKLVVLGRCGFETDNGVYWHCQCDCGCFVDYPAGALNSGRIASCGCLRRKDITGKRFGKLVVLEKAVVFDTDTCIHWHCQCDCGGFADATFTQLQLGQVTSCGCDKGIDYESRGLMRYALPPKKGK